MNDSTVGFLKGTTDKWHIRRLAQLGTCRRFSEECRAVSTCCPARRSMTAGQIPGGRAHAIQRMAVSKRNPTGTPRAALCPIRRRCRLGQTIEARQLMTRSSGMQRQRARLAGSWHLVGRWRQAGGQGLVSSVEGLAIFQRRKALDRPESLTKRYR